MTAPSLDVSWWVFPAATNTHARVGTEPEFLCGLKVLRSARPAGPRRGCSMCASKLWGLRRNAQGDP